MAAPPAAAEAVDVNEDVAGPAGVGVCSQGHPATPENVTPAGRCRRCRDQWALNLGPCRRGHKVSDRTPSGHCRECGRITRATRAARQATRESQQAQREAAAVQAAQEDAWLAQALPRPAPPRTTKCPGGCGADDLTVSPAGQIQYHRMGKLRDRPRCAWSREPLPGFSTVEPAATRVR